MYKTNSRPIHLLKRGFHAIHASEPDSYDIEMTFQDEQELISFLYRNYDPQKGYWFDGRLDKTGTETTLSHLGYDLIDGNYVKRIREYRQPWLFAEELSDDWWVVINPYDYSDQVKSLIERKGAKKQGPEFRREPVPKTGKRKLSKRYRHNSRVKHTAWWREEKARQQIDKDEYDAHYALPVPKCEDWYYYHKRSHREFKSWKNKKIRRQWMKNAY